MDAALQLSDLGRFSVHDGPYLSVYLPTANIEEHWRELRPELGAEGAPSSALELVDTLAVGLADSGGTLAVITDQNAILVTEVLTDEFLYSRGAWAGTADLVPILKNRQERGANEVVDDDARRAIKTEVAEDTVTLLERFQDRRGQTKYVADGIHETVDAINRAMVDVLLVRDDRDERRDVPREDAAVIDALVRDAIATGAGVRVIPASGPVREGVGALLRSS